jgi:hypothetical protein
MRYENQEVTAERPGMNRHRKLESAKQMWFNIIIIGKPPALQGRLPELTVQEFTELLRL